MTQDQAGGAGVPEEEPVAHAPSGTSPEGSPEGSPASGGTGHPAVDEVLRSLELLDDRPVEEHVAVFEQAHETLRRTLNDAGDAAAEGAEGTSGRD